MRKNASAIRYGGVFLLREAQLIVSEGVLDAVLRKNGDRDEDRTDPAVCTCTELNRIMTNRQSLALSHLRSTINVIPFKCFFFVWFMKMLNSCFFLSLSSSFLFFLTQQNTTPES